MASEENKEMKRVLIFGGKTGWIGGLMMDMIGKEEGTIMTFVAFRFRKITVYIWLGWSYWNYRML